MRDAIDMEVVNSNVAWRLLVSMILSIIDVIHTFLTYHAKINEVVSLEVFIQRYWLHIIVRMINRIHLGT